MRLNPDRLARSVTVLLWLLGGVSLAGFGGAWWWGFDLCAHFRVQYLSAALLFLPILWYLGRRRMAVVALLVLLMNLVPVLMLYRAPALLSSASAATGLQVMSLNVWLHGRNTERVIAAVRRQKPDVLVLLEVTEYWRPALQALDDIYPFSWLRLSNDAHGIAILSRQAPLQTRAIYLGNNGVPSLLLTLAQADTRISILGTHLNWPLGPQATQRRNRQLAALARLSSTHPWPLAIVGDLNITPFSPVFTRTLRDGGLYNCARGAGFKPSWPAGFPPLFIPIDHCLATQAVRAQEFSVGRSVGSDHYPITVRLSARP